MHPVSPLGLPWRVAIGILVTGCWSSDYRLAPGGAPDAATNADASTSDVLATFFQRQPGRAECARDACAARISECGATQACIGVLTCWTQKGPALNPTDGCGLVGVPGASFKEFFERPLYQLLGCTDTECAERYEPSAVAGYECAGQYSWPLFPSLATIAMTVQIFEEGHVLQDEGALEGLSVRACRRRRASEPDGVCDPLSAPVLTDAMGVAVLDVSTGDPNVTPPSRARELYVEIAPSPAFHGRRVFFNRTWHEPSVQPIVTTAWPRRGPAPSDGGMIPEARHYLGGTAYDCTGVLTATGATVSATTEAGAPLGSGAVEGIEYRIESDAFAPGQPATIVSTRIEAPGMDRPVVDDFRIPVGGDFVTDVYFWPDAAGFPPP